MRYLKKTLQHLARQLERVGGGELTAAATLVKQAMSVNFELVSPEAEHALFYELWGHVTGALDHNDFDSKYLDEIDALESEMAGRVLSYRLARGWLIRAEGAVIDFQSFSEITAKQTGARLP